jgi:hypothetical protein
MNVGKFSRRSIVLCALIGFIAGVGRVLWPSKQTINLEQGAIIEWPEPLGIKQLCNIARLPIIDELISKTNGQLKLPLYYGDSRQPNAFIIFPVGCMDFSVWPRLQRLCFDSDWRLVSAYRAIDCNGNFMGYGPFMDSSQTHEKEVSRQSKWPSSNI